MSTVAPKISDKKDYLSDAAKFVASLFETQDAEKYAFHNLSYIHELVADAESIASQALKNEEEREQVLLATWFLYSGFSTGYPAIAEKSIAFAEEYLSGAEYPKEGVNAILASIRSVHDLAEPKNSMQAVLFDASIAYTGKKKFKKHCRQLRKEHEAVSGKTFSDTDWKNFLLGLMSVSVFHTKYARKEYGKRKQENFLAVTESQETDQGNYPSGAKSLEKGVDTLFRTQARHLTALVGIADKKAQMIIGVNSISLSILLTTFEALVSKSSVMAWPAGIFVAVNVITIICAIFVISPATPKAETVKKEDVLLKHGFLFSQVMFANISYEDFRLGIQQMMADENYLYDTLIQSLYANARVLEKKFRMLRIAYRIFVAGLASSVLSLGVIVLLNAVLHK